ncbi:hypothetical protein D299_gp258 [Escherichia phage HX01]|nr:hypothetical protein D299_gp258 [Escherichia phage HX01]
MQQPFQNEKHHLEELHVLCA